MTNKISMDQASSVRVFSLLVNLLLIVTIIGVALSASLAPIGLIGVFKEYKAPIVIAGIIFCNLLTSMIYLWIIYFLRKLMLTVKERNPFDQTNPGRIRKISYAVFALVPVDICGRIMMKGLQRIFSTVSFVDLLWGSLFKIIFLAFGLLVISKVFELGVELQRDQKLTI